VKDTNENFTNTEDHQTTKINDEREEQRLCKTIRKQFKKMARIVSYLLIVSMQTD
jgi:hypothetical protein